MASNTLAGGTNDGVAQELQDEWAGYNLSFRADLLSEDAKWWLRQYLRGKYHKTEEERIYQVLEKTTPMLTDGSQRDKEWWARFLWQVALIYRRVPDAVELNMLYGKIGTPGYVKVADGLGKSSDWERKLAVHALQYGMDGAEITKVISEEVLEEVKESFGNKQEMQQEQTEQEAAQTEAPVTELSETPATVAEAGAVEVSTSATDKEPAVGMQEQIAPLAAGDKRRILEAALEVGFPTWQPELIEWLADIIEKLRQDGMSEQREESLFKVLQKPDKTDWEYVIIEALERPGMQRCLTKRRLGSLEKAEIMQLLYDLTMANDSKIPGPKVFIDFSKMGLGLPLSAECTAVMGKDYWHWADRLNEAINKGHVAIDHQPSRQALLVHKRDFKKKHCHVLTYRRQNEKTLTVTVQLANHQLATWALDFSDAEET